MQSVVLELLSGSVFSCLSSNPPSYLYSQNTDWGGSFKHDLLVIPSDLNLRWEPVIFNRSYQTGEPLEEATMLHAGLQGAGKVCHKQSVMATWAIKNS